MSKRQIASLILPLAVSLALAGCTSGDPLVAYPAAEEHTTSALRAKTDLARGQRWELRWGTVAVYDVATERLVRTIELPGAILASPAGSCTPDLVLARSGAAWISSNAAPVLWRISPERFEVERFELSVDDARQRDIGFSALALGPGERQMYAASAATGTLWRVELAGAKAAPVELTEPIQGACGLRLASGQGSGSNPVLAVTVGSAKGAQVVKLAGGGTHGVVRTARTTELASAQ